MRNSICLFLLILAGCHSKNEFMIKGHLQDASSNGEYMYLLPLENSSIKRTDSVLITNQIFEFKGSAAAPEIYIIRARPLLRLKLQELLIVKESGVLNARIGNNSSIHGTALNDSLQKWKEKKMMSDSIYYQLLAKYNSADKTFQPLIKQEADSLNSTIQNFHYRFVRNNRSNVVGKLVSKMFGSSFTLEQKKELGIQ